MSADQPPDDDPPPREHDATEPLPVSETPGWPDPPPDADDGAGARRAAPWQWMVLALIVGVLAALAIDAALRSSIESRVAEEAERELGGTVDVELQGFASGLRSLSGRVPGAEVHGREVPLPDTAATMTELHLSMTDVRVDRAAGRLEASTALVDVTFDAEAVEEFIGVLGRVPLVDIELRPGTLRLRVGGFSVADATVRVDQGALVISLTAPLDRILPGQLRLTDFPLGFRPDDVTISEGQMRLHGRAEPLVIEGTP